MRKVTPNAWTFKGPSGEIKTQIASVLVLDETTVPVSVPQHS